MDSENKILTDKKTGRITAIITAVILSIIIAQLINKIIRGDANDFSSYLLSADALLKGGNPYNTGSDYHYIYPLSFAFLLIPLTLLPHWASSIVWLLLNLFSLIFSYLLLTILYKGKSSRDYYSAALPGLFVIILLLNIVQNNLLNGQVNIIILMLCILFIYYFRLNQNVKASLLLAVAISIKLVPIIFLVFVVWKRKYLLVLYTALFLLILIIGLPYLLLGNELFQFYNDYINSFLLAIAGGNVPSDSIFFTLEGFILYIFPSVNSSFWIKVICGLLIIVCLLFLGSGSKISDSSKSLMLLMSLYFLSILLISPMSEIHHLIFILPALTIVTYRMIAWNSNSMPVKINFIIFILLYAAATFLKANPFYFLSVAWLALLLILELYSGERIEDKFNPV